MKNFKAKRGGGPRKNEFGARNISTDRRSGGRDGERTELHRATCSKCGNECQVPFRPNGKKPLFCSTCFGLQEKGALDKGGHTDQMDVINAKLDRILKILTASSAEPEEREVFGGMKQKGFRATSRRK